MGALHKYEAQQGGFHGDPVSGHQPLSHLRNFSGNTQYLPGSDFQQGWQGQGSKCASKTLRSKSRWRMRLIHWHVARQNPAATLHAYLLGRRLGALTQD